MIWFISTSYSFVNPRGFREHLTFFVRLPGACIGYRRMMNDAGPMLKERAAAEAEMNQH